jgi:hypothetical protein
MAKANISTKDGTTIQIQGTAEDIAKIVACLGTQGAGTAPSGIPLAPARKKRRGTASAKAKRGGKTKTGPASLVADMIGGGASKKPKVLTAVMSELKQGGHFYTDASIAVALLRAVKRKELRRVKEDDNWAYVV